MAQRAAHANPNAAYQRIAQKYRDLIDSGTLPPGTRLNTVEEIATQEEVSRSTAHKAMIQLNHEGYVHNAGIGTHVLRGGAARLYVALAAILNELEAEGQHLTVKRITSRDGGVIRDASTGRWRAKDADSNSVLG